MGTEQDSELSRWFQLIIEESENHEEAIEKAYLRLRDMGKLSKVTLHRYMCKRGCQLATVFKIDGMTLCAVRDYKFSPGLNNEVSVEAARVKNTLDGERHWPAHVYDVQRLSEFSAGPESRAGMDMNCRHRRGTVFADDILKLVDGVRPGQPGKPTRL